MPRRIRRTFLGYIAHTPSQSIPALTRVFLIASGIHNGAGSRDQESIGEAVNGYYGAMLWAEVTGRKDIVKYCRLLIAMEQHAAKVYWHLYPESDGAARDQPYPEREVRSLVTIGTFCHIRTHRG